MSKQIPLDAKRGLSPEEVAYVEQRPWLKEEIKTHGLDLDDLAAAWKDGNDEDDDVDEDEEGEDDEEIVDLSKMTKPELVAFAEENGVDSSGTKPELIARLLASQEEEEVK